MPTDRMRVEVLLGATEVTVARFVSPSGSIAHQVTEWRTLAPGSRSEKVQRLGEAYEEFDRLGGEYLSENADEQGSEWQSFMESRDRLSAALAALRQHDTEHGRMG